MTCKSGIRIHGHSMHTCSTMYTVCVWSMAHTTHMIQWLWWSCSFLPCLFHLLFTSSTCRNQKLYTQSESKCTYYCSEVSPLPSPSLNYCYCYCCYYCYYYYHYCYYYYHYYYYYYYYYNYYIIILLLLLLLLSLLLLLYLLLLLLLLLLLSQFLCFTYDVPYSSNFVALIAYNLH